jgi:hypothetical protein
MNYALTAFNLLLRVHKMKSRVCYQIIGSLHQVYYSHDNESFNWEEILRDLIVLCDYFL